MFRIALSLVAAASLFGQTPPARAQLHPLARPEFDRGALEPDFDLSTMVLLLERTPQQQADLDRLIEQQRDPSSPNYRRWLTPEEFGTRFGVGDTAMTQTRQWLESQGLRVESVGRGRSMILFRGNAGQAGRTFGTELHRYESGGEIHFANARAAQVPGNLPVSAILGLHDFNPKAQQSSVPTRSPDGSHVITPADLAVLYNFKPLREAGIDGTGVTIAITGQSELDLADVNLFREQFLLPPIQFQRLLLGSAPGFSVSNIAEANLDVQWAGAVAPNAEIVFVYSRSAFLSLVYALDQNVGQIVSNSYGFCETYDPPLAYALRASVQQANAQGITVVSGSNDSGAAGCDVNANPIASNGLRISIPGDVPEVTVVGGTTLDDDRGGAYSAQSPDASGALALGYIPETVWNDTSVAGYVVSGGGGFSRVFSKPPWQAGKGVPNDGARDVPDVSLAASARHDGYAYRRLGVWGVGGGVSAAAPVFAGIVGLLNHYLVSQGSIATPGLGNINGALYRMAQSVPEAFHDIVSGDNIQPCAAGTPDCVNGKLGYAAGPGYDLASGLGSVDADNLIRAWDAPNAGSSFTLTTTSPTATLDEFVTLTAIVRPMSGTANPAGTVAFTVVAPVSVTTGINGSSVLGTVTLSPSGGSATATLRVQGATLAAIRGSAGRYTIVAVYSGSAALNGAGASVDVNVTLPASGSAVVPRVVNYNVRQPQRPDGSEWSITITAQELAGVATRVTSILVAASEAIPFFSDTTIPARGARSFSLAWRGAQPPVTLPIILTGEDASGARWTRQTSTVLGVFQDLTRVSGGLLDGASFQPRFAPGMVTSAFGTALAFTTGVASSLPLPTRLGETTVTVNGVPAPLYYASSGQLNFQIPYETKPGVAVFSVTSRFGAQEFTNNYSFTVSPVAPGIFAGPNNTLVPFASGKRGDTLLLFITGDGELDRPLATGRGPDPSTPLDQLPKPKLPVTVSIGGVPATLQFAGVPPGLAGVTQVNFTIGSNTPLGLQPVVVRVGSTPSTAVNLTVSQ